MTSFGIYFVIFQIFGVCSAFFYAGNGGSYTSAGIYLFAAVWGLFNLLGILIWGTGLGV